VGCVGKVGRNELQEQKELSLRGRDVEEEITAELDPSKGNWNGGLAVLTVEEQEALKWTVTKWAFKTHGQRRAKSRFCRFSGSCNDVAVDSVLVGYDTASLVICY
jgi:hypothetical protein